MPLLKKAKRVQLARVDEPARGQMGGADIAEGLARHKEGKLDEMASHFDAVLARRWWAAGVLTALAGVDLRTLVEAARSLGAGWTTTVVRVVIPNIWSGILAAAFISTAVVLGEYTIASLLTFHTLPVEIVAVGGTDGRTSIAASLAVLLFGFALLLGLTLLTGGRRRRNSAGV